MTCETRLANLGFNQDVRDAVLGHAKPGLQKTYNKHDYLEEKRAALLWEASQYFDEDYRLANIETAFAALSATPAN